MTPPLPRENPRLPDEINNPPQNPLLEFGSLLTMVAAVMVGVTLLVILLVDLFAPRIPFHWEAAAVSGIEIDAPWPEANAELNRLADEMMASMEPSPSVPVTVHLLDMDLPNAFASLGGHVLITRGLLESVATENGLAMVLAHEIGHIQHRDPVAALGRGLVLGLLLAAVTGGDSFGLQALFGQSGGLTALRFNRDMERRADRYALQMLDAHYGHTLGADEFFRTMLAHQSTPRWQALFHSHPLTDERIEVLQQSEPADLRERVLVPLPPALRAVRDQATDHGDS